VAEAIARLESLPPGRDLAMAYSSRSQQAMLGKRLADALEFGQRALDLAAQFGDHVVQTHALNNIGTALLCSGGQGGLEKLEQSLAVALEHDLREHAGRAYANLVSSLIRQRSDLAERYVLEGSRYCEAHDVEEFLPYIRACTTCFELNRGHWDKAAQAATRVLERDDAIVAQRLWALVTLALARARRGDPGVDPLLDEALPLALATCELLRIGPVAAARAEVAWYRGDPKRAGEEAGIGLKAAVEQRDPWIQGELSYWAWRADPHLEVAANLIAEPYALMIEGDWKGAAAAWQQRGAPYERALALADGPEEALRESLSILEQLGAGPLAAIVRQRLRALGVHGIPRGPRASTRGNPAGLTSREVQVLSLLVHGHTNSELAHRLHVSNKTVEHHVSAILEKLEVHSRTEAVAAAFGLGIVTSGGQAGDIAREDGARAPPSSVPSPSRGGQR
jgi:DNA-binding CsgD family transcriptional regulator